MASGEILDEMMAIESAILSKAPALLIMLFTPAAIPLLSAGTQPIMELVLGEKNIPEPKPMMSIHRINSVIDVVDLINISPPRPTAVISSPTELKTLVPYRSGLSDRYGTRVLSSVGLLITAVGLGGLMLIKSTTSITELILWMLIMGFGSGMFFSPNTSSIMGCVPADKRGIAAGVDTMMSNAGALLSIALSMAIILSSISPDAMQALFLGNQVSSNGIATNEFVSGLRMAFTISFIFSLVAAGISFLRGPKPEWDSE